MRDASSSPWRPRRVALLVAGHLRELCSSESNFAVSKWSLGATVAACRRVAKCDLFVFSWAHLDQRTPTWHGDFQGGGENNASACAERVRNELSATIVELAPQPKDGCSVQRLGTSALSTRWAVPVMGGARQHDSNAAIGALTPSYGAVRCQVNAVQRVNALRLRHEAATGRRYDAAVRLRPDLYDPMGDERRARCHKLWAAKQLNRTTAPCEWRPFRSRPDMGVWRLMAGHGSTLQPNATVLYSCEIYAEPGEKNGDQCYFSVPPAALDALVEAWDAHIADRAILTNACRHGAKANGGGKRPAACDAMRELGGATRLVRYPENMLKLSALASGVRLVNVKAVLPQAAVDAAEREANEWAAQG